MRVDIGLESNLEGRSLAWGLAYPGCFAYGKDDAEAVLRFPAALIAYAQRIQQRAADPWLDLGDFDVNVAETWTVYFLDSNYHPAAEGYEINAWFLPDWKPLARLEIERGLEMLRWSREDLLGIVAGLSAGQLDQEYSGERWTINGILKHLGSTEWWFLDRLDLAGMERSQLPAAPLDRLQQTRARLVESLPETEGRQLVRGKEGQFWSPRKLLRRALWHELDHIEHILKLLTA